MQHPIKIYRNLVKLRNAANNTDNLNEVIGLINEVVTIHANHKKQVQKKVEQQDFNDVIGIDFNVWAYDIEYTIEAVYNTVKNKYYDLHFQKNGFNAY